MRAPLVALGLLLGACAASPAPLAGLPRGMASPTPAPATTVQPAPIAGESAATPATTAQPTAAPSATVAPPSPPTLSTDAPQPPRVLLEPPYSALGHPRLATEMLTLGRDEELFQWALGGSSDPAHPANRPGFHPATRVVVDVQLLSRAPKGSTKRLERIARSNGYWPLRACFESAQRSSPKPERAARVRLTLAASGKVLGARNVGATPERDYARCVLQRVRGLDFTPGFTRKLDVEIGVKQWPGHAPVPPRAPDDAPLLRLPSEALAALEGLTPALTACYEKGLATDALLWGRIALKLTLAADGTVQSATPVETQFPSAEVLEWARQTLVGARITSAGVTELTFAVRFGQGAPPAPMPATPGEPPAASGAPPAPVHSSSGMLVASGGKHKPPARYCSGSLPCEVVSQPSVASLQSAAQLQVGVQKPKSPGATFWPVMAEM